MIAGRYIKKIRQRVFLFFCVLGAAFFFSGASVQAQEDKPGIVEERGGRVKVVRYTDGAWKLLVDGQPFFIKGVVFGPVKIGEDPGQATMRDWMYYDDDQNDLNDIAFEAWVDENKNNKKDTGEDAQGDFQILKEMGGNTIRLYHVASDNPLLGDLYKKNPGLALQYDHAANRQLLRKLYADYGIMVIMGNFLGSWTIGAGTTWEEGMDYTNPRHLENVKKSVKAMVLDHRDEPYVLMWQLGNENNIADWSRCNARTEPEAYAKFIGELTAMIHELDPNHPVAVCDGEDYFRMLKKYAKHAPEIDVISYNSYRNKHGFGLLWGDVKKILDRPVFISEYGIFAYNSKVGEDEDLQLEYLKGCWKDIVRHSAEYYEKKRKGIRNSIGGTFFDWLDRWYMDGTPYEHNPGHKPWNSPDGLDHEEWFGLLSMGDGSDTLMRQKRKSARYLEKVWNEPELAF